MNLLNILPSEFAQSLRDSICVGSTIIAGISIAWLISALLHNYEIRHELKKLKKWRKFSEIEKRQKHEEYDRLAAELSKERAFNDTQGSMHVRLMLKYAAIQEESEKTRHALTQKETFITELKKEIEQYQYAVKDLRIEIDGLKAKTERKRNERGQFVKANQEKDWTTATKDELLDEAKRRYPVGTKVKCLHNTGFDLIETDSFKYDKYGSCMRCTNKEGYVNCVYDFGKWAQIIHNA